MEHNFNTWYIFNTLCALALECARKKCHLVILATREKCIKRNSPLYDFSLF